MDSLREAIVANSSFWLPVGGLLIGALFGAIVQTTNFCTMGSLSDMAAFGDSRRFRAWVLAAGLAILGAQILAFEGVAPLTKSMYLAAPRLNWAGNVLGGLFFGVGMALAGGCASRNLVRVGAGDLRSLVNLIFVGLFAYITIGGLFGPIRVALENATSVSLTRFGVSTQSLGDLLGASLHVSREAANLGTGIAISIAVILWAFSNKDFATSKTHVAAALGVALCVIAGWALTGLAYDEMAANPAAPISLTYVRPAGDSVEWLQRYTALGAPGFGVATVGGAILGAFFAAKLTGRFRISTFADPGDMLRNLTGAMFMGVGGVMGLGCTIGQAVTGVSTLAVGSFLTFVAIVVGGLGGVKLMERLA
ncbi:YeeE/YedE family protein [Rhodoblastus sp.]|uniref:YeeE/YedE family protein n=1 Tax=Rhodoblastus sp. TaxID=1962975 RepID=UPI00263250CB|nr:YeeE/YedE family protein [Rhodoblastus sp.]